MNSLKKEIKDCKWYLLIILFLIGLYSTKYLFKDSCEVDNKYNRYVIYDLNLELKYWSVKSKLIDSTDFYIKEIAPETNLSSLILVNECLNYNIDLILVITQAQKESHFGTKGLGFKTNSIWNVGAYDGYEAGEINKLYKYPHVNESIEPYLKLLKERYLVNKTESDLLVKFTDINDKRFASYIHYESDLSRLYNKICNDTRIDDLYKELIGVQNELNY